MKIVTKNTAQLRAEVTRHVEADAVARGQYWIEEDNAVGGRGCFIGCLAHSDDADKVTELYGLPLLIVRLAESIFESLPTYQAVDFFDAIPDAVGSDGKDLNLIHWHFIIGLLDQIKAPDAELQATLDATVTGLELVAAGGTWEPEALNDTWNAAYANEIRLKQSYDLNSAEVNAAEAVKFACLSATTTAEKWYLANYIDDCRRYTAMSAMRANSTSLSAENKVMADLLLKLIADAPITTTEGELA